METFNSFTYYVLYTLIALAIGIFLIRTLIRDLREVWAWIREEWKQRHSKN